MTTRSGVAIDTLATPHATAMIGDTIGPLVGTTIGTEGNTNTMKSTKGGGREALREGIDVIGRRITTGGILSRTAEIMREMIGIGTMTIGGTEIETINMEEITRKIEKTIEGITANTISTKKNATEIMNVLRGQLNMRKRKVNATTRMRGLLLKSQRDIRKRTTGTKRMETDSKRREIAMSRMTVTRMTGMPPKTTDTQTAI